MKIRYNFNFEFGFSYLKTDGSYVNFGWGGENSVLFNDFSRCSDCFSGFSSFSFGKSETIGNFNWESNFFKYVS